MTVVPVEERGMPTQKSMQKPKVTNIPEVKPEQFVARTIISAKDKNTQIAVPEKT